MIQYVRNTLGKIKGQNLENGKMVPQYDALRENLSHPGLKHRNRYRMKWTQSKQSDQKEKTTRIPKKRQRNRKVKQAWKDMNWTETRTHIAQTQPDITNPTHAKTRNRRPLKSRKQKQQEQEINDIIDEIHKLDKLMQETAPRKTDEHIETEQTTEAIHRPDDIIKQTIPKDTEIKQEEDIEIEQAIEAIHRLDDIIKQTTPKDTENKQTNETEKRTMCRSAADSSYRGTVLSHAHTKPSFNKEPNRHSAHETGPTYTGSTNSNTIQHEHEHDSQMRRCLSPSPPMGMRETHIPPFPLAGLGAGNGNQEGSPTKSMGQKRSHFSFLRRRSCRRQARAEKRRLFRSHGKVLPKLVSEEDSYQDTQDGHTPPHPLNTHEEYMHDMDMIEAEEIWIHERSEKLKQLRIATFNAKGASHLSGREKLIHMMEKNEIDVMMVQEMKVNSNSKETHENYTFLFSTGVTDKQRADAQQKREDKRRRKKKKAEGDEEKEEQRENNRRENMHIFHMDAEKLGMAAILSERAEKQRIDFIQKGSRICTLKLKGGCDTIQITGVHIPCADAPRDNKDKTYELLQETMDEANKRSNVHIVVGDFNARIMETAPREKTTIGPHYFAQEGKGINTLSTNQKDNRNRMIEFAIANALSISNTWFIKPQRDLVTYRSVATKDFRENLTTEKYAQLDYIMVQQIWKNTITNIHTTDATAIASDHKLIVATVRIKLANKKKPKTEPCPKYWKPTQEQAEAYNEEVRRRTAEWRQQQNNEDEDKMEIWTNICKEAAAETLTKKDPKIKKPYISKETWDLMERRVKEVELGNTETAEGLTTMIQKQCRRDKLKWRLERLEESDQHGYKWEELKTMKKKFTPQFAKLKDNEGKHIPVAKYAEKTAQYLDTKQWEKKECPEWTGSAECVRNSGKEINNENFTTSEILDALRAIKNGKTPGPDKVRGELLKWLDMDNAEEMKNIANWILARGKITTSMQLANVVSIYKKGDSTNLSNYRPISLLQTSYKLIAAIIKERLTTALDEWICATQYGFRKSKSTSHAIFLARRVMDIAEKEGNPTTIILLDWEKAFDKIDHQRMMLALDRVRIRGRIRDLIGDIYNNPQFRVEMEGNTSEYRKQQTGIRQGCPLSPYIFIIVMAVIIFDIKQRLNTPKMRQPIKGIEFAEILYADDTLIFGNYTRNISIYLKEIEEESAKYNMKLNYDKCVNLTANQKQTTVRFKDGTLVPRRDRATYLGTILSDSFDQNIEINNRIADVIVTANKLKIFWTKAKTTTYWKLTVFDAILRAKLLYGLECIQLTNREQARINAFQVKGLRRILGIPPTHIDRTWTNEKVWQKAEEEKGRKIQPFVDTWKRAKYRLLGHILRTYITDPMRQVVFEAHTNYPRIIGRKRVGRPRDQWINFTLTEAYELERGEDTEEFDPENNDQMKRLIDKANERTGIFAKFKPEPRSHKKAMRKTPRTSPQTTETPPPRTEQGTDITDIMEVDEAQEAQEWLREAMITAYIPD